MGRNVRRETRDCLGSVDIYRSGPTGLVEGLGLIPRPAHSPAPVRGRASADKRAVISSPRMRRWASLKRRRAGRRKRVRGAHAGLVAASETKTNVRNRYVSQVLLATFGFGIILAVIAALQTPAGRPVDGAGASRKLIESPQCHAVDPPAPKAAPGTHDSKADCDFSFEQI